MDEGTATVLRGSSASVTWVRHSLHRRLCRSSMRSVSRPAIARQPALAAIIAPLAALAALAALAVLAAITACDRGAPKPPAAPVQQQAQADPAPATAPEVAPVPPAFAPPVAPTPPAFAPPVAPVPPATARPVAPVPPAPGSLPAAHEVTPLSADELQRKRAEWQELQRTQEQARSELEAWRRSRRLTETKRAMPRVGVGQGGVIVDESDRMAGAMRAWYRHYSARSAAVSTALSQYGLAAAANPPDPARQRAACRELLVDSQALLADPLALPAPLDHVSAPLSTAYTEIEAFAGSCLAHREDEQAGHLAAAHQAMAVAGAALSPYHMAP